jgi:CheY-like chemotaxis protein
VKDTGIGIPEDRQKAVFERFVQADLADSQGFEGVGLGLAISKAYIEMMGGEIGVKSRPKKGSEFYFTLPYDDEFIPPKGESTEKEDIKSDDKIPERGKVLLVEDDETAIALFYEFLTDWPIELYVAKDGNQAMRIQKENGPLDLVLMDLKLPKISGIELTKKLHTRNSQLPIVAQSAYVHNEVVEEAKEAGCVDYLMKPIQQEELNHVLKVYLNDKPHYPAKD